MKLKKINSVLTLIVTGLFFEHCLFTMYVSLSHAVVPEVEIMKHALPFTFFLHFAVSELLFIFSHDMMNFKKASKPAIKTILQRITGPVAVIMIFAGHAESYNFLTTGEAVSSGQKIFLLVKEIVLLAACMCHMAVSLPRAFLTLGWIVSERVFKIVSIIWSVFCAVFALACAVAIVLVFVGI